jgi:hypothetical protein
MLALTLAAIVVLVLAALVGAVVLRAGRELEGSRGIPVAARGSVAARVDAGLQRTRLAVEELVLPETDTAEVMPSAAAQRNRAQTYVIIGTGLLGLAAAVLIGLLLVL